MSALSDIAIITVGQARTMEGAAVDVRLELIDGVIYAMGRASPWHAVMTAALVGGLRAQMQSPCRVAVESIAIAIHTDDASYVHPDVTILCGPSEYHPDDSTVVLNPRVVFEVLSPSTAARDWNDKLPKYKSMVSVRVIAYIDYAQRRIVAYFKTEEGWEEVVRTSGTLELRHLNASLDIDALYDEAAHDVGGPA